MSRGPKWLAVIVIPMLLSTLIPGISSWLTDRFLDYVAGTSPVTVSSKAMEASTDGGQYWATDSILTRPGSSDVLEAVRHSDGAPMSTSTHLLTLQSNRSANVYVDSIDAIVEKRGAPLGGTAFVAPPQGSGDVMQIDFRLDSGDTAIGLVASTSPGHGKPSPYLSDGRILYVSQGVSEHLMVSASTKTCSCSWRVRIGYSYRGQSGTAVVPPLSEKPFTVTAWVPHRVEYNVDYEKSGRLRRHDCTISPADCHPVGHLLDY